MNTLRHRLPLAALLLGSTLSHAAPFTWDQDTDETINTEISGTEGLEKSGSGTLTLAATNTFTGTISIFEGVLAFTTGHSSNNSALGAGATGILLDGGTLRYIGTSGINIGGGGTQHPLTLGVNGGTIEAGSANRFLIFGQTGAMGLSGDGARTLTLGGGTTDARNKISLRIGDQGGATSLVKTGSTTWTIDGLNTHSGSTTISQGRLQLGSATTLLDATGDVLVNGGALSATVNTTVGGNLLLSSGVIDTVTLDNVNTGAVTNNTAGFTLADGKDFVMSGGTWTVDILADASRDQINGTATGAFSITGGTLALRIEDPGTFDYSISYTLLNDFGTGSVSGLTIIGYDTENWTASLSDTGVLAFSTIPEPSTASLLVGGVFGTLALLRRRRTTPIAP